MKIILFLLIILVFSEKVYSFTPINPLIDVGKDIYFQFNEKNDTIFTIKKSGKKLTLVYKIVVPSFTAKMVWTKEGKYIEDKSEVQHGATSPEDFIPVKGGEEYFVKLYGCGNTKLPDGQSVIYAPIVYFDSKNNFIKDDLTNTWGKPKNGTIITVPQNAAKMYITNYNNQGLRIYQRLNLTDEQIDKLPFSENSLKDKLNSMYNAYTKDRVLYKKTTKAQVVFEISSTSNLINEYIDIFLKKKIPLSLAVVPENLIDNCKNAPESRLHAVKRLEQSGLGEIFATNQNLLNEENLNNYSELYKTFIRPKQYFNNYGLNVNGIIFTGGTGSIKSNEQEEKWVSSIYSYTDYYGINYGNKDLTNGHAYYQSYIYLGSYANNLPGLQTQLEKKVTNKEIIVLYFNSFDQVNATVLNQILDYAKNLESQGIIELSLFKNIYTKTAIRENKLLNTKTKYYVSSSGSDYGGLSEKDPMSWSGMRAKTFIAGDTIMLKNGDIFYGQLNIKFAEHNNATLTVTNYGDPSLGYPIICGYKVVKSKSSWTVYDQGRHIYQIDFMNTNNYEGVMATDNYTNNIGFILDDKDNIYGHLKWGINDLLNDYDFFCNGKIMLLKTKGKNPYEELGRLRLATRTYLAQAKSYMKLEHLHITGTGGHGMYNNQDYTRNVEISNNIIDFIGGVWQHDQVRFGNGIEFWESNVRNLTVQYNIIRNVYDSGFTIQGHKGSGENCFIKNNLFISNAQDNELFELDNATGIFNYIFEENLSINQGRGWGFESRPNKGSPAFILFFSYQIENNTKIIFRNNTAYNPRRLYYASHKEFFKKNKIQSDNNTFYINNDTTLWYDMYGINETKNYTELYNKDNHSKFILLNEIDEKKIKTALKSNNFWEIRDMFIYRQKNDSEKENSGIAIIVVIILVILILLIGGFFLYRNFKKNHSVDINKVGEQNYGILPS